MNKQEAIVLLTRVLPFGAKGKDYQTTFNGTPLSSIDELITHLEEDFGEFVVDGVDPETGDTALVYIEANESETSYNTPSPCGLTLKVMEALYTLVP